MTGASGWLQILCAVLTVLVATGCSSGASAPGASGESESEQEPVGSAESALSSYSNCTGGCPEGQHCVGWYDQGYCTPLCESHDDCRTGCCTTSAYGTRACGPISACLGECEWDSRHHCVTDSVVASQSCGEYTVTATYTNECTDPVRIYSCITSRPDLWDCRPDGEGVGLAPGESFVHEVCDSGGYALVWTTSYQTFEEHRCLWPLP